MMARAKTPLSGSSHGRGKQLRILRIFSFSAAPALVLLLYVLGRPAYFALNAQLGSSSPARITATKATLEVVAASPGIENPIFF